MPHAAAITPTEMATTWAKTWTSGIMARACEGDGKYALERTSRPPCGFPRACQGLAAVTPANRRVGTLVSGLERGPFLAQKLFHGGLRGDRFGDLVADVARRLDRRGDPLDARASELGAH